jgi:hypothetical protein
MLAETRRSAMPHYRVLAIYEKSRSRIVERANLRMLIGDQTAARGKM